MTEVQPMALDDVPFLEGAYQQSLGRPPDPKGLRDYLQRLREGATREQLLAELQSSVEGRSYAARSGGGRQAPAAREGRNGPLAGTLSELEALSEESFVDHAYRLILGRRADDVGLRDYQVALRTGVDRLDVLRQLLESDEGRRRNAPVPEIRNAIEKHRLARLPIVRQVFRAWNLLRRQLGVRRPRSGIRAAVAGGTASKVALPTLKPVSWPPPPSSKALQTSMNDRSERETSASRLGQAARSPASQADATAATPPRVSNGPCEMTIEKFVGPMLHGWSIVDGEPGPFSIEFGGRILGKAAPMAASPGADGATESQEDGVRFSVILGGLLQFSAMAHGCSALRLSQGAESGGSCVVNLYEHLADALTFSPMRALIRPLLGAKAGKVRSMRLLSILDAAIVFEADQGTEGAGESIFIDLYQEPSPGGSLTRLARFAIDLTGQIVDLEFRLLDPGRPLLMVVTDADRSIIATDCFPLPSLFSDENAPLVEYHVVLETGKPAFGVTAKISRTFLDSAVKARMGESGTGAGAHARSTCVVMYAHGVADVQIGACLDSGRLPSADCVFLDSDGQVHRQSGERSSLLAFVETCSASHFLFIDVDARLRPDFWSVLEENRFRLANDPDLVHWHAIYLDGVMRPQVVKSALLLHPTFDTHQRLEARSVLVRRDVLTAAVGARASIFRSGRLVLEEAFTGIPSGRTVQLPIVMETVRIPILPLVQSRYQSEHVVLPSHPARAGKPAPHTGVSIIINYRDGVDDTLRCLQSLRSQDNNGPLEVILVNNGSTASSVNLVLDRARNLFGNGQVLAIDYPERFNHSTQCNVAAVAAAHPLLLMLSNDSCFRTPTAISRSAEVASVPWVGSCGYRIVGNEAAKGRLQSLGLALNERRYLFAGGSPVTTGIPPDFAWNATFEVLGNTFAAVMLRKDVYVALDGLDSEAFPTNYNDIDFSFRASNAGYRHVVIGSEIVEHMGRGSREADQDLPIDQRIIERAPRLDLLARVGFQQL